MLAGEHKAAALTGLVVAGGKGSSHRSAGRCSLLRPWHKIRLPSEVRNLHLEAAGRSSPGSKADLPDLAHRAKESVKHQPEGKRAVKKIFHV